MPHAIQNQLSTVTLDARFSGPGAVAAHASERVPSLGQVLQVDRMIGGHLNFVWRVVGTEKSVIVKVMAPFVASDPSILLDLRRVEVEASSLELLSPEGTLSGVLGETIQVPGLLDHDCDHHILILEDLGDLPDLGAWIEARTDPDAAFNIGRRIGEFIGHLHRDSADVEGIAGQVMNTQIQRTRLETQYRGIRKLARSVGVSDANRLGDRAVALGEQLCRPGCVFIMGDLWPRSMLVSEHHLAIIDWELAHWGRPAQDVGHFVAHLWMLEHRAAGTRSEAAFQHLRSGFLSGYGDALGSRFDKLFGFSGLEESQIHAGAEILVRTVGRFKGGYVYDGLDVGDAAIKEAVGTAASLIRGTSQTELFGDLGR